jgi:poly-gamma-glutamate synthesis protein (capsule biosynthesis protein)
VARRQTGGGVLGFRAAGLRDAVGVFANLECAITTHAAWWSRTTKVFHFRASPGTTAILRAANIRWVSLANNHSLDFE